MQASINEAIQQGKADRIYEKSGKILYAYNRELMKTALMKNAVDDAGNVVKRGMTEAEADALIDNIIGKDQLDDLGDRVDGFDALVIRIQKSWKALKIALATNPITTIGLAGIIVTMGVLTGTYIVQQKKLAKAIESYQNLTEEVESLEQELTNTRDRIKEINELENPTLVDQQELEKLRETNEELERQLRIKKILQADAAKEAEERAMKWLDDQYYATTKTVTNPYTGEVRQEVTKEYDNWYDYLKDQMQVYRDLQQQLADAKENRLTLTDADEIKAADEAIAELQQSVDDKRMHITSKYTQLNDTVVAAIGETAESDEAKAFLSLWDQFEQEYDEMIAYIEPQDIYSSFEEHITSWHRMLLNSENFGGNVDLTRRRKVAASKMAASGWSDFEGLDDTTDYATIYGDVASNEDGTLAIAATPILPNGEVLEPETFYRYVDEILAGGEDRWGITLGVFKGDDAVKTATEYTETLHLVQEEWDEWVQQQIASGNISSETATQLDNIRASLLKVSDGANKSDTEIGDLTESLSGIVEKYDFIKELEKEYGSIGSVAFDAETLDSLYEKFPVLRESISLYIAGLKSAKELMADIQDAYKVDEQNYYEKVRAEMEVSTEFYGLLTDDQKTLIDDLAKSYNDDLGNFSKIAEAKLEIEQEIIKKLAIKWDEYAGLTLDQLKTRASQIKSELSSVDIEGRSSSYGTSQAFNSLLQEYHDVSQAIKEAEEMHQKVEDIVGDVALKSWNPSKYSTLAKKAAEDAEDAFEKLKEKLQDWFSDMEFQVELRFNIGDIEGTTELYQQMIAKARELLDSAYNMGRDITDDWVQELITKVNTYKKSLADLRTDEYDKLIEYNDKFDVWNHVSYSKLDKLEEKLEDINEQYREGLITYQDYYDAFMDTAGQIYDIQKESLETLLEEVMNAIEADNEAQVDALEEQKEA